MGGLAKAGPYVALASAPYVGAAVRRPTDQFNAFGTASVNGEMIASKRSPWVVII
jgi:hypothetical protein